MANEIDQMWYTKYRPKTLEEYSGPQIKNIVAQRFKKREDYPHTIFVKGPRGTGKTTICRLLSKYYLCDNPHEDGTPCEECDVCTTINEVLISGNGIDTETPGVLEVDATTANGKEEIQEIVEDAIQAPIYTTYKVVIFDECHMITPQAQNSLLKILEDIPSHLVCMFCTTNEEKVLQTIKSRMQLTLEARKQTVGDMRERLETIAKLERLTYSKEALEVIAKRGNRVPRECINILESIAKTHDRRVTVENIQADLGGIPSEKYIEYFKASNNLGEIMMFIRSLKDNDIKYSDFIKGIVSFVMDSLYIKHGIASEEYPLEYVKTISELFKEYTSSEFDILLQIIEYMTNQSFVDDEAKIEMLLVVTAMRISKIDLLAKGLVDEQKEAIVENKKSLYEHSKTLKHTQEIVSEKLKIELGIEEISESFEETTVIQNTGNLLKDVDIPDIQPMLDSDDDKQDEKVDDSSVDSFFD